MGRSKGRRGAKSNGQPRGLTASVVSKQQEEEDKAFFKRALEIRQEAGNLLKAGKFEHAKQSYEKALQLLQSCKGRDKEAAVIHGNLGAIFMLQRDFDESIKECSLALDLDQTMDRVRQRRERAYEITGNLLAALADTRFLLRQSKGKEAKQVFALIELKLVEQIRTKAVAKRREQDAARGDREPEIVPIKLEHAKDVRLLEVEDDLNYAKLKALALEKFPDLDHFNVKVRDEDGDEITLTSGDDIAAALKSAKISKFFVLPVAEGAVIDPPSAEMESMRVLPDLRDTQTYAGDQIQAAAAAAEKKPEEEVYELDDWMIDFAELFKEHLGIDIDTPLDLSKVAWEKCAEALDSAVHNDKSEALLRQAANKFEEVILTALVNLGNVYMCVARKYIDGKKEKEDSLEEIAKADVELDAAKTMYKTALERKADFADAILSLGQLEFEKGKISTSFGVPEGHKYHVSRAEEYFLRSIDFFKDSLGLLKEGGEKEKEEGAAPGAEDQANVKAQAKVMWGNALYELSQVFAQGDKDWKPVLTEAIDKFKEAKCQKEEVTNALKMHCKADEINKDEALKSF